MRWLKPGGFKVRKTATTGNSLPAAPSEEMRGLCKKRKIKIPQRGIKNKGGREKYCRRNTIRHPMPHKHKENATTKQKAEISCRT